jgi:Tfp pilus assembly protein PilF
MNTSLTRRSILAATSLVLAAGLALGACGGSNETSTKKQGELLNAGLQAEVQGDYATAKKNFEELLKADSTNKYAHYNLGYIAQTQDRDGTEAAKQYEAALKTDPEYGPALYNLAIIKTANGDDAGAILLYQRAGTANPTDANTQLNLGLLLYKTGDTAGADAAFRKAIALNPAIASRIPADQQPKG